MSLNEEQMKLKLAVQDLLQDFLLAVLSSLPIVFFQMITFVSLHSLMPRKCAFVFHIHSKLEVRPTMPTFCTVPLQIYGLGKMTCVFQSAEI